MRYTALDPFFGQKSDPTAFYNRHMAKSHGWQMKDPMQQQPQQQPPQQQLQPQPQTIQVIHTQIQGVI